MKEKIKEVLNRMIVNYNLLEDNENVIEDMEYLYDTHADDIVKILNENKIEVIDHQEINIVEKHCERVNRLDNNRCLTCGSKAGHKCEITQN